MTPNETLPAKYIQRKREEDLIREEAKKVARDKQSRAILLYGKGGLGKTHLLRHLAEPTKQKGIIWLQPFDADDSEYWLLANLERKIAHKLNEKTGYFSTYLETLSKLPVVERGLIGHETVISHLRRSDEQFLKDYDEFLSKTKQTLVITLDTIETIRGTDFMIELTQWMKRLPRTLIILAGRPPLSSKGDRTADELAMDDPIVDEFTDEHLPLSFIPLKIEHFSRAEAFEYFNQGWTKEALSQEEKEKLVLLTQGHPLWLALTEYYLSKNGIPQEAQKHGFDELTNHRDDASIEWSRLQEDFHNQLLLPFKGTDFWHESIRRLAVLRRRVDRKLWQKLMSDCPLPPEAKTWNKVWKRLLDIPWVRQRFNDQHITLHDVLAEELALNIIPLQDKGGKWRRRLWENAERLYADLVLEKTKEVEKQKEAQNRELRREKLLKPAGLLVQRSATLEAKINDLHQLTATHNYYQLLSDREKAARHLAELFKQITANHDFRLGQLLWMEFQRFLGEAPNDPLESIIRPVVERFKEWFYKEPAIRFDLLSHIAEYLTQAGNPHRADGLLSDMLEEFSSDLEKKCRLLMLRGNARMRLPEQGTSAKSDFDAAVKITERSDVPPKVKEQLGEAYKELGFFYRHMGFWEDADKAYANALRHTSFDDQLERASIQSNWAYVEALIGNYQRALELVNSALLVRRNRNEMHGVAMALSVRGEVYRYQRDFLNAWKSFEEAEDLFKQNGAWGWLGQVYQQQAACRFQEWELDPKASESVKKLEEAHSLALRALDLCKDWNMRAYPSALNRAGRIFVCIEPARAITFLTEGVKFAREMGDGWMLFANLVELVELSYHQFAETASDEHRERIKSWEDEINKVSAIHDFRDLKGRWELVQGHIALQDSLRASSSRSGRDHLKKAFEHYKIGFPLIALGYVGSHGIRALPKEFAILKQLLTKLPVQQVSAWCEEAQHAWSEPGPYVKDPYQIDSLHAHITEIYEELVFGKQTKAKGKRTKEAVAS